MHERLIMVQAYFIYIINLLKNKQSSACLTVAISYSKSPKAVIHNYIYMYIKFTGYWQLHCGIMLLKIYHAMFELTNQIVNKYYTPLSKSYSPPVLPGMMDDSMIF